MELEIIEEETIKYLTDILEGKVFVSNPMRINILRIGEGIATSMCLQRYCDSEIKNYFTFERGKEKYEFFIRGGKIYQEIMEAQD